MQELEALLHVQCKAALLKLYEQKRLARESNSGLYVYFSGDGDHRRAQRLAREKPSPHILGQEQTLAHELKAAILLFHGLLDEKQRRLYAGLEAYKLGHGGDETIARLLGVDRHTVAKGRREVLGGEVSGESIRDPGAGRKPQEKKRRKSSNESKGS